MRGDGGQCTGSRITGGRNTDGSCTLTERKADIRMWVLVGHSGKKESPQIPTFQSPVLVTYFVCSILRGN